MENTVNTEVLAVVLTSAVSLITVLCTIIVSAVKEHKTSKERMEFELKASEQVASSNQKIEAMRNEHELEMWHITHRSEALQRLMSVYAEFLGVHISNSNRSALSGGDERRARASTALFLSEVANLLSYVSHSHNARETLENLIQLLSETKDMPFIYDRYLDTIKDYITAIALDLTTAKEKQGTTAG